MYLKVLLITIVLVALIMLALSVKLFLKGKAEFTEHACAAEDDDLNNVGGKCAACEIKGLVDCRVSGS